VAPPGNQAENRENKHQPIASEETGLLAQLIEWSRFFLKVCPHDLLITRFWGQNQPAKTFGGPSEPDWLLKRIKEQVYGRFNRWYIGHLQT
jgi:hypothetical protein